AGETVCQGQRLSSSGETKLRIGPGGLIGKLGDQLIVDRLVVKHAVAGSYGGGVAAGEFAERRSPGNSKARRPIVVGTANERSRQRRAERIRRSGNDDGDLSLRKIDQ